jgi:hypothetical protein
MLSPRLQNWQETPIIEDENSRYRLIPHSFNPFKNQDKSELYLNIQSLPRSKYTLQLRYENQLANAVYEKKRQFYLRTLKNT